MEKFIINMCMICIVVSIVMLIGIAIGIKTLIVGLAISTIVVLFVLWLADRISSV